MAAALGCGKGSSAAIAAIGTVAAGNRRSSDNSGHLGDPPERARRERAAPPFVPGAALVMHRVIAAILAVAGVCGCTGPADAPRADASADSKSETDSKNETGAGEPAAGVHRLNAAHLPNALRVHPRVICGGLPEDEAAFEELRDLGVRTIISVDGARPDVELARRYGLRYVHLPHGYDGISEERRIALAKAVRDLPGPLYIHCHHGKHRSPAAAAVACVAAGLIAPNDALPILEMAGTSPNYHGLYEAARQTRRLPDERLDAFPGAFAETSPVPKLAAAMVDIERIHDRLKQFAEADWQPLDEHPDLIAAHEALLIREQFTELLRSETLADRPAGFRESMKESEAAAEGLEAALRASPPDRAAAAAQFERVTRHCANCHRAYRDNDVLP
jgi:protein tyrosine phosphatase (PTP) superfamily phosphohydrolase (DUF442 family)/predicted small lipoprotein YifL